MEGEIVVPRPRPAFRFYTAESWAGPGNEVVLNIHSGGGRTSYGGPNFTGFTKFTQLHVVTSQFYFLRIARARIEAGTGSRYVNWTQEAQYKGPCKVNFHLQLALVLQVLVLYL